MSVYFSVRAWKFSGRNNGDWIAVGASIVAVIYGFYNMRSAFYDYKSRVSYSELHDLFTVARFEAENAIINIGGDLSWLGNDNDSLRDIKNEHPDLQIKIYYDKNKLSDVTKNMILDLQAENVVCLIPHPEEMVPPNIRCMITDYSSSDPDDCKIFLYPKIARDNASQHKKDKFEWQENTRKTNPALYETMISFLDTLDKFSRRQVVIGVCGINNCGKTSIISKCMEILQNNFTVKVIKDDFSKVAVKGKLAHINRQIIFCQIAELNHQYPEDIVIFDRTPFNNFIYLMMRDMKINSVKPNYKKQRDMFLEYKNLEKTK